MDRIDQRYGRRRSRSAVHHSSEVAAPSSGTADARHNASPDICFDSDQPHPSSDVRLPGDRDQSALSIG
jgi:hypothetical protein